MGIFLLIGIALIAFLTINLGNLAQSNKPTYNIKVRFQNASGLIKGCEVRLGGAKIGKVISDPVITNTGDAVEVVIAVDFGIKLQRGSQAQAATLNLLGDKYIEIVPPASPTGMFIDDQGNGIIYGDSGDDLETIKGNVATISHQTIILLDRVGEAMDDMQKAAKGYAALADKLNSGVLSDKNLKSLEVILDNTAETSSHLANSSSTIPETLENVREATKNIKETSESIRQLVVKVDKKIDEVTPVIDSVEPVMKGLRQTTDRLNRITGEVEKGRGLMGSLIYDKNLKTDVMDFIRHVRAQGLLRYKNPQAEDELLDLRDREKMQGRRN